jgi:hypothetical protein
MEKRKQVVADTRWTEAEAPTATKMQKTDSAEKKEIHDTIMTNHSIGFQHLIDIII